ncbi:General transcription factor II-I repeat domain-containing protein 2, partial [Araneus ventricosus]
KFRLPPRSEMFCLPVGKFLAPPLAVVKLVNTIRSRGLTHRQFRDFLQSVQSEYSDVLYYTKVRWLSAGCVFERVWQLKDDIVSFFHEKQCSAECEMLEDTEWLSDFAFFTDLFCHMNNLTYYFVQLRIAYKVKKLLAKQSLQFRFLPRRERS